jgi:hypothetical protein
LLQRSCVMLHQKSARQSLYQKGSHIRGIGIPY